MQEEFDIIVDWRGFELHPEAPAGGLPLSARLPASRAAGMREYLLGFAAGFGIADLETPEHLPNTRRALTIAEHARGRDRPEAFRQVAMDQVAMDAHLRRGENLDDADDLRTVARRAGPDPEAAIRAMDDPAGTGQGWTLCAPRRDGGA